MPANVREFSAPWSLFVLLTTIGLALLVFVVTFLVWFEHAQAEAHDSARTSDYGLLLLIVPLIFAAALFFAPCKFTITDSQVIVGRLGANVAVPLAGISDVKRVPKNELGFVVRVWGVGGFCGTYGLCYSRRIGLFRAYMTNRTTLVLITLRSGKKVLLSPERPEEFLNAVVEARNRLSNPV